MYLSGIRLGLGTLTPSSSAAHPVALVLCVTNKTTVTEINRENLCFECKSILIKLNLQELSSAEALLTKMAFADLLSAHAFCMHFVNTAISAINVSRIASDQN